MDFNSTVKGSLLEGFYPEGWDFEKIDVISFLTLIAVFSNSSFVMFSVIISLSALVAESL